MVTDEEADRALHWLLDNTNQLAAAEADLHDLKARTKVELAIQLAKSNERNHNAREAFALSSQQYQNHLTNLKIAELKFAELSYKWQANERVISVWQSKNKRDAGPRI